MAKARISVGVDDATGQPANAPEGPYITDEDDGSRPRRQAPSRRKGAPRGSADNAPGGADDLASRRKGPAQP
jgi:hypothetical protein